MSAAAPEQTPHPSRPAADPPSPARGEGSTENGEAPSLPSPLAGEGARRADEGFTSPHHRKISALQRGRAKAMRHASTEAEERLWYLLRDRRFVGHKFRRQFPIDPYIVDFVCLDARLIVEADGGQHAESARDQTRDVYLCGQNFRLLRLWNGDILARPDDVLEAIWAALHEGESHGPQ